MALIVAVDIGGTFTDLLGYDDRTGRLVSAKSSTTPQDFVTGILDCLEKIQLAPRDVQTFVHGSTVAINTVIERKGARTALVVTRGARDVYAIGRGNRPDAYDIWFKRPRPLVPRQSRPPRTVPGRAWDREGLKADRLSRSASFPHAGSPSNELSEWGCMPGQNLERGQQLLWLTKRPWYEAL